MAKELDVRIMTADIIYHLFDQFGDMAEIKQKKKDAAAELVSFHCELKSYQLHLQQARPVSSRERRAKRARRDANLHPEPGVHGHREKLEHGLGKAGG